MCSLCAQLTITSQLDNNLATNISRENTAMQNIQPVS